MCNVWMPNVFRFDTAHVFNLYQGNGNIFLNGLSHVGCNANQQDKEQAKLHLGLKAWFQLATISYKAPEVEMPVIKSFVIAGKFGDKSKDYTQVFS